MHVNICKFATFGLIFMKFSPNSRAKELGMLFTILGIFTYIFGLAKGPIFCPKIGLGKSLVGEPPVVL